MVSTLGRSGFPTGCLLSSPEASGLAGREEVGSVPCRIWLTLRDPRESIPGLPQVPYQWRTTPPAARRDLGARRRLDPVTSARLVHGVGPERRAVIGPGPALERNWRVPVMYRALWWRSD